MDSASSLWLPAPRSTVAEEVDYLFYFILDAGIVIFAIVVGLMLAFGLRYRRRGRDTLTTSKDHNLALSIRY